jgi:hypothetical protein
MVGRSEEAAGNREEGRDMTKRFSRMEAAK